MLAVVREMTVPAGGYLSSSWSCRWNIWGTRLFQKAILLGLKSCSTARLGLRLDEKSRV